MKIKVWDIPTRLFHRLLAAAYAGAFHDPKKVEKWFKRNCQWVPGRECTPKEKGDFITYMISL